MGTKSWGFDTAGMDKSVRPQDDFYHYANGNWLKRNTIPPAEVRWGSFNILRHTTEKQLRGILGNLLAARAKPGSPEQLVRDIYISALDFKTRNKLGTTPLAPYLARIAAIHDHKSLLKTIAQLQRAGIHAPWGFGVDQDSKNSERYMLHLYQAGLGMPDRDYYLKDAAEFVRVRTAYTPFVAAMFRHLGYTAPSATAAAATVLKVETALAKISMDKVDRRDAEKTYHKYAVRTLTKLAPIHWTAYFKDAGIPRVNDVIVMQPEFLKQSAALLQSIPLAEWKTYLTWQLLEYAGAHLSQKIAVTNFNFFGRTLAGQKQMRAPWRRALAVTNAVVGFALGRIYIDTYFGAEARRKMSILVDDLFAAYEARMTQLDWMSPKTKKLATHKLRAISRKIGYPTKWRSYKGLTIRRDDYFGNLKRAEEHAQRRELAKLKKPIDRTEWHMTPQTVNAYCNFTLNEIVFPAAILQHPFFDAQNDDAVNYGAIGSVIGHELTHAFDDQGSKFDARGNMRSWWTAKDRTAFEKRAAVLVKQYNAFTVADGVPVNGKLTLGENIADLGGAVIAYDALQKHLAKVGRKDIDGFTPEQRFFLGFAQQEQELTRPEYQKMAAINDPHSPARFRINGIVTHVPEFYEAFGVKKGDKMYRHAKDRAKIW